MTIEEYKKRKDTILEEVGDNVVSPRAIADIIGVPFKEVGQPEELKDFEEFEILGEDGWDADSFTVEIESTIDDIKYSGVSPLLFVIYCRSLMCYFFTMSNKKDIRVRKGALMSAGESKSITSNLLSIFEEFKIKEIEDHYKWVSTSNRFDLLDLE